MSGAAARAGRLKYAALAVALGFATPALLPVSAQAEVPAAIVIDAAAPGQPISPFVYGANFGPLNVVPVDLIEEAQQSGIRMLRFPGGRIGDQSDLQPAQIDGFITLVRGLGAEPLIHVRLEGGTPEAAAELVRYTNLEQGYGVRYWSIGNEPDLYNADDQGDYTPERQSQDWRRIAEAMRAVDASIEFVGPDISQFTGMAAMRAAGLEVPASADAGLDSPYLARVESFMTQFLRDNSDMLSVVSVHRYPFPTGTGQEQATHIEALYADAERWTGIAARLHAVVEAETGRDLPIAITEVNSHWSAGIGGQATPDSYANAVWWADVLRQLIDQQTFMVDYFNLQTSDRAGGHGLLARYEVRPTYLTYQLYQQLGDQLLPSASWHNEAGTGGIVARRSGDGALTVLIVNRSFEEQTQQLSFTGSTLETTATLRQLTRAPEGREQGIITDSSLTLTHDEAGQTAQLSMILPPESVSLIVLLPVPATP